MLAEGNLDLPLMSLLTVASNAFAAIEGFKSAESALAFDFIYERLIGTKPRRRPSRRCSWRVTASTYYPVVHPTGTKRLPCQKPRHWQRRTSGSAIFSRKWKTLLSQRSTWCCCKNLPKSRYMPLWLTSCPAGCRLCYRGLQRIPAGFGCVGVRRWMPSGGVMVNAEDPALRANRLGLLNKLHLAMNQVADLSKLSA